MREGKSDSGVSTFPCINLSSPLSGLRSLRGTRLGRRPLGQRPRDLGPPTEARCSGSCGGASRGATAGSGGARPGAGRRTSAGGRCFSARDGLRGGRATAAHRGLRLRQTSLPVLAGRRAAPGGCTAASALTWPSRERPAARGGGGAGRPPPAHLLPAGHRRRRREHGWRGTARRWAQASGGRTGGGDTRAGSGLGPSARGLGRAAWRAGGAAAGPCAAERHGRTGAFVIPRSALRAAAGGGGSSPLPPQPRAGRGGVGAGERAAAVAGPGPLCSPPSPPPAPAARGSAILASGAWRRGGRRGHRRCPLGSAPPARCRRRRPPLPTPPAGGSGGFQGHFLSSGSF